MKSLHISFRWIIVVFGTAVLALIMFVSTTFSQMTNFNDIIAYFNAVQKGDWKAASKYDEQLIYALKEIKKGSFSSEIKEKEEKAISAYKKAFEKAMVGSTDENSVSIHDPFPSSQVWIKRIRAVYPPGASMKIIERKKRSDRKTQEWVLVKISYKEQKPYVYCVGDYARAVGLTEEDAKRKEIGYIEQIKELNVVFEYNALNQKEFSWDGIKHSATTVTGKVYKWFGLTL